MRTRLGQALHTWLERRFPEKRLFLRSDDQTRFIRLRPETQLIAWTIIATAVLLMDSIGAGNFRSQAARSQLTYEERLNAISSERDVRATEALAAQGRFSLALAEVSRMQSELLRSEDRRRELETAIDVMQATLRRTVAEREAARDEASTLQAALEGDGALPGNSDTDATGTVDLLAAALAETAEERDQVLADAEFALDRAAELELELRLLQEKNDQIFGQLEEAFTVSVEPLDDMFRAAGMDPDRVLNEIREGYSGTGGPLTPLQFSTRGGEMDPDAARAKCESWARWIGSTSTGSRPSGIPFDMPVRSNLPLHQRFRHALGPDAQRHRFRPPRSAPRSMPPPMAS